MILLLEILLIFAVVFTIPVVGIFGSAGLLYYVGERLAPDRPIQFRRCTAAVVRTLMFTFICGFVAFVVSFFNGDSMAWNVGVHACGTVVAIIGFWKITQKKLELPFRKTILISLPSTCLLTILLLPVPMLAIGINMSLGGDRDLARDAMSKTNLKGIATACLIYAEANDGAYPPDLQAMLETGEIGSKTMHHPKDKSLRYFYCLPAKDAPPQTLLACEPKPIFYGRRNVVYLNRRIERLPEPEFQKLLKQPENAKFAEALEKASIKNSVSAETGR